MTGSVPQTDLHNYLGTVNRYLTIGALSGIAAIVLTIWTLQDTPIMQSPDSQEYLALARSVSSGEGFTHYKFDGREMFGAWWAPMYPVSIGAIHSVLDVTVETAARYLNCFSLLLSFLLFSIICWQLQLKWWLCVILNGFLLTSSLLRFALAVHSEILFLPLALLATLLGVKALRSTTNSAVLRMGLVNGANVMVRYAGIGISGGMALAVALLQKGSLRDRICTLALGFGPTILVYFLWSAYSLIAPKGGFHRSPGFHLVSAKHWDQLAHSMTQWLNPSHWPFWTVIVVVSIVTALVAIKQMRIKIPTEFWFLVITVAGYFTFLLFSISLLDYNTPLSERLLLPVLPLCLLAIGILSSLLTDKRQVISLATIAILLLALANHTMAFQKSATTIRSNGMYLNAIKWVNSEGIQFVKNSLSERKIYSNIPYLLRHYVAYRQDIVMLPYEIDHDRFIEQDRPSLVEEYRRIQSEVNSDSAVVILFKTGELRQGQDQIRNYLLDSDQKMFEGSEVYY